MNPIEEMKSQNISNSSNEINTFLDKLLKEFDAILKESVVNGKIQSLHFDKNYAQWYFSD